MATPILPETPTLLTSFDDGLLRVTLNRPERRNAMSDEMLVDLQAVMGAVRDDPAVRIVVLRGAGGIFSAGGDLKNFRTMAGSQEADRAAVIRMNRRFGDLIEIVDDLRAVLVSVIDRAALAGGMGLAASSDVVITEPTARFSLTETTLGLVPAQIAPVIARRIGVVTTRRLAVTAARFDGIEAERLGLVDIVTEDLDGALDSVIADVRLCGPDANAFTKRLINQIGTMPSAEMFDRCAEVFADAMLGEEAAAGIDSFLKKTPRPWASGSDVDA